MCNKSDRCGPHKHPRYPSMLAAEIAKEGAIESCLPARVNKIGTTLPAAKPAIAIALKTMATDEGSEITKSPIAVNITPRVSTQRSPASETSLSPTKRLNVIATAKTTYPDPAMFAGKLFPESGAMHPSQASHLLTGTSPLPEGLPQSLYL